MVMGVQLNDVLRDIFVTESTEAVIRNSYNKQTAREEEEYEQYKRTRDGRLEKRNSVS